jgi:hypothetical protein
MLRLHIKRCGEIGVVDRDDVRPIRLNDKRLIYQYDIIVKNC